MKTSKFWGQAVVPCCFKIQSKTDFLAKTTTDENTLKKRYPPGANSTLWAPPEAPGQAASRTHFLKQKQQFSNKNNNRSNICKSCWQNSNIVDQVLFVATKIWFNFKLFSVTYSMSLQFHCNAYCYLTNCCFMFKVALSCSDTPWAKARRILNRAHPLL